MASYDEEGLYLDLGDLCSLQVCVRQYADRTTDVGTYVQQLHEYDGKERMKVVVAPHMWIGVDIYHTLGSYSSRKVTVFPYEWALLESHDVGAQSDATSRAAGIWAINKSWEAAAPDRIQLDAAQRTVEWKLREIDMKRTLLVIQFIVQA